MTGFGIYKLESGESCPSYCFPIRSHLHPRKEGPGHWLVAHRSAGEDGKTKKKSISEVEMKPQKWRPDIKSKTLNEQLLIAQHCVDEPSDLCSVNISGLGLQTVVLEGLEKFDNVAYINASDNHLTLEPFGRFPALRELELSLNSLHRLKFHVEDFQKLEVLDLSFNNIAEGSLLNLGVLPFLKVLHLTGNHLQMLPFNMCGPHNPGEKAEPHPLLYQSLEVLMLDDNKLTSPGVFLSLANLKRLRHLNLQGNDILGVPLLGQIAMLQDEETGNQQQSIQENYKPMDKSDFNHDGVICISPKGTCRSDPWYPFPELHHLNLAKNEIVDEEALLPVALFPKLRELVIHSNPLTMQKSGDPPMLTSILQNKLGVQITRKNTTVRHNKVILCPKTKVKSTNSNSFLKLSLSSATQPASEVLSSNKHARETSLLPSETGFMDVFDSAPQTRNQEEPCQECFDQQNADNSFEMHQNAQPFFVTEMEDLECELQRDPDTPTETHLMMKTCPEKLIGYEILLDDTPDSEIPEISGVQDTIKILDHMLKNLLVDRDPKAIPELPQKPYIERERKIKSLPPVITKKSKGEKMEELLAQMKEMKTARKVPLGNVLEGGKEVPRKEYMDAQTLLKDLKKKYSMARLQKGEEAVQIDRENLHH